MRLVRHPPFPCIRDVREIAVQATHALFLSSMSVKFSDILKGLRYVAADEVNGRDILHRRLYYGIRTLKKYYGNDPDFYNAFCMDVVSDIDSPTPSYGI